MSKLLATKVSLPLSENVTIGPKVSIFCVATMIVQHCLNSLGHGVHQSFTGRTGVLFHSSMTTSQSWWMLETLRSSTFSLRMPHRCSIGFRSGDMLRQTITFPLSKAVVIIVLEYCPATQSPKGRGSCSASVCHSTSWHSLVPSMNCSSPVPAALMQPQTMTLPPPCLTVGKTQLSLYSSPGCRHTRLTPSEPNKFILVSSDHRTWFQ